MSRDSSRHSNPNSQRRPSQLTSMPWRQIWRVLAKNPEGYPMMRTPKPNVDRPTVNQHAKRPLVSRIEPRGKANDTPTALMWQGRKRGPPVPGPPTAEMLATLSQRGWTQKEEPCPPTEPAQLEPRPPLSARSSRSRRESSLGNGQGRQTPRARARAVLARGEAQMGKSHRGSATPRGLGMALYDCGSRAETWMSGASTARLNTPARRERELRKLKKAVLGSLEETEKSIRIEELYRMRDQVRGHVVRHVLLCSSLVCDPVTRECAIKSGPRHSR